MAIADWALWSVAENNRVERIEIMESLHWWTISVALLSTVFQAIVFLIIYAEVLDASCFEYINQFNKNDSCLFSLFPPIFCSNQSTWVQSNPLLIV